MKPEEIRKLTAYFKRVFQNPDIDVKARPRKEDSAEVYVGDDLSLSYRFPRELLGDWAQLDAAIRAKAASMLRSGG